MRLWFFRLPGTDNSSVDRWLEVFQAGSGAADVIQSTDPAKAGRAVWLGEPFIIAGSHTELNAWLTLLDDFAAIVMSDCAYWWLLSSSSSYTHSLIPKHRLTVLNWAVEEQNIVHDALQLLGRFPNLGGLSNGMHHLRHEILRISSGMTGPSETVAIIGGSGSGKEEVAHALFDSSNRASRGAAMQCISASWLNMEPGLALAEIVGIEKGVANEVVERPGLVELYSSGALMVDDFDSGPRNVQEVLLRLTATRRCRAAKYRRIGGREERETNVWLIFATNVDFRELIEDRRLRFDFMYRFGDRVLKVPLLRERPADIPAIARRLWHELLGTPNGQQDKWVLGWDALRTLISKDLPWDGNVRELQALLSLVVSRKRMLAYRDQSAGALLEDLTSQGRTYLEWFIGLGQDTSGKILASHQPDAVRQIRQLDDGPPSGDGLTPCEAEVRDVVGSAWTNLDALARKLAGKKLTRVPRIRRRMCRYILFGSRAGSITIADAEKLSDVGNAQARGDLSELAMAGFLTSEHQGRKNERLVYTVAIARGAENSL